MPDREQSTAVPVLLLPLLATGGEDPPAPTSDESYWRETFLLYVGDLEHQRILRELADMLQTFILEYRRYYPDNPKSWTQQELQTAAADLRNLERFLAGVSHEPDKNVLDRADFRLADLAERLAPEVGTIAGQLEAAVGSVS